MNSTKNSFLCEIEASHEGDRAHAEVVAYFERVSVNRKNTVLVVLYYIINLSSVALRRRKILIYDHILVSLIARYFHLYFVGK